MKLSPRKEPFRFSFGKRGEVIAAQYLHQQGYRILEQNFRCKIGEIDVVAEKEGRILFIEVKTRRSDHFGLPEEAVHSIKQKKITRAAEWYLKQHKMTDRPVGFEVLAIDWPSDQEPVIRCIPNAFSLDREL